MKRILLGMIAVGMCLVFCSCNQEAQQEPQPYEALLTYMDAQEYEKAYQELLGFSSEYKNIQENYEKKRKNVLGTWTAISDKERETFVLKEDGTCVMGKHQLDWNVRWGDWEDKLPIEVDVKFEKEPICRLFFEWEPDYQMYSMRMELYKADGTCKLSASNHVYYYNEEKIEVVELTEENFWEYFEIHAFTKWYKNGLGEVSDASYKTCFCLKSDYVPNLLTRENELNFEYKAEQYAKNLTVDLKNQIMDEGEFENPNIYESKVGVTAHWDGAFSIEEDCQGYYPVVFVESIDSLYLYDQVQVYLYNDFEILQARGQLVWVNE